MRNRRLLSHGVDGTTGEFLSSNLELVARIDSMRARAPRNETIASSDFEAIFGPSLAPRRGVDPRCLSQAGWGLVTPPTVDPAIREAIEPLVRWRRELAGDRFTDFTDRDRSPWRCRDTANDFLIRNGQAPGNADVDALPYYLLLVGGPGGISFEDQFRLGVHHAVGRLDLESAESYEAYALRVIERERAASRSDPRLAFFGPSHPGDELSEASSKYLVGELAARFDDFAGWHVSARIGADATKRSLTRLLMGPDAAQILLAACHGVAFPRGDPKQVTGQGSLLCQDWPGPKTGPVQDGHAFWPHDLHSVSETGDIVFLFTCYGGGTSRWDAFAGVRGEDVRWQASASFVSPLSRQLLGGSKGGALAVVAHVDRAWGYSFVWDGIGAQTYAFEDVVASLVAGEPVGAALEPFRERHKKLAIDLADLVVGGTRRFDHEKRLLTAYLDARQYVILGDPAVRVRTHSW